MNGEIDQFYIIVEESEGVSKVLYLEKIGTDLFRQAIKLDYVRPYGDGIDIHRYEYGLKNGLDDIYNEIGFINEINNTHFIVPTFTASA